MDKTLWPDWLKAAKTKNAIVKIKSGVVSWEDGIWEGGTMDNMLSGLNDMRDIVLNSDLMRDVQNILTSPSAGKPGCARAIVMCLNIVRNLHNIHCTQDVKALDLLSLSEEKVFDEGCEELPF